MSDVNSTVHERNRLATCQTCHKNATPGFITFQPHGHAHDFKKYPHIWITEKFMIQLLVGTFAFFWLHSALWFYREWKDRKQGKTRPHVSTEALPEAARGRHYERFSWIWRLAHLTFAVSLMILTLTGMTALYAESNWAPVVARLLGGPQSAAYIHRVFAVLFAFVFFAHLIWMAQHIARKWRAFQWFGPNSLIPRWQDLKDAIAMFRWFFGTGERPVFDRWTYWEKFDYWAVFWGMAIIGGSGLMLWFPEQFSRVLPGWVFNIALLVHGEEALLAVGFIFTIHFFNGHLRPEKFPMDMVIFTGSVPESELRHERAAEYDRLRASGDLERLEVPPPSPSTWRLGRAVGTIALTIGTALVILIVFALITT